MKKFNRLCPQCGESFSTNSPTQIYDKLECSIDSKCTPSKPRNLIVDESNCKIWRGDVDSNDNPIIVVNDKILKLRNTQIFVPEGKRINVDCGNKMCVNENHYRLVDDLSHFGYI